MARVFVGIAWPYANGPFHIGHLAGAYLPGEIFARFHRLRGDEVLMVSGSDMHGTPILVTAEKEGVSPETIAFRYDAINREAFRKLGFSFDLFTHTHTTVHERTVKEVFLALLEHGFVRRRTENNAYCPKHARFLPDRYLVGECPNCHNPAARGDECDRCGRVLEPRELIGPKCSLCGTPAEFRPSEHFYLELDALASKLNVYLADKSYWRANVLNVAREFQNRGLHPTPITRDLEWGVPLPLDGYETKRFYVWFDAVIGYLSASKEWAIRAGRPDVWRRYWAAEESVQQYYFIGKDNVFHHTIVWPSILLGHEHLQLPYDVPANEWLLVEGQKISKSRPADLDAFIPSLLSRYPPDVIRFYAALLAPQNHDTEFDWDEFHRIREEILSNQYGNLAQRLLVLTRERYGGQTPEPPPGWTRERPDGIGQVIRETHARITTEYEAVRLKEALDLALGAVREANRRVQESHPWDSPEEQRRQTLYEGLWLLKAAAVWLAPVLPFSSAEVWRMLGYTNPPGAGDWGEALEPPEPGQTLGEIRPLFPREDVARKSAKVPSSEGEPGSLPPLEVRAGRIVAVENHPSADKLYVMTVDVGEKVPRTVVAGVRPFYQLDELGGRAVVILANLQPRTIRRVTSQGMILAAEANGRAVLLSPPSSVSPGTLVDGVKPSGRTITHEEFQRVPLVIGRVVEGGTEGDTDVEIGARTVRVSGRWKTGLTVVVRLEATDRERGEILSFGADLPLLAGSEVASGVHIR